MSCKSNIYSDGSSDSDESREDISSIRGESHLCLDVLLALGLVLEALALETNCIFSATADIILYPKCLCLFICGTKDSWERMVLNKQRSLARLPLLALGSAPGDLLRPGLEVAWGLCPVRYPDACREFELWWDFSFRECLFLGLLLL